MVKKMYYSMFKIMLFIGILTTCLASDLLGSNLSMKSTEGVVQYLNGPFYLPLNESENYRLNEIAIVVKDINAAVDVYTKTFGLQFGQIREYKIRAIEKGEPNSYIQATAFARLGPIEVELIQIVEGESIHTEFLKVHGEGIHHLGFKVADLEKEMKRADALGLKLISSFQVGEILVFAYYEKCSGIMIELVQENVREKIEEALKAASQGEK